jgi:hypothetical protein
MSQLDEIRERAAAATPGPWMWDGNLTNNYFVLATAHSGICTVMGMKRKGMQNAEPYFHDRDPNTEWKFGANARPGWRRTATELAIFEVCRDATSADDPRVYRKDIVGFRSANATFIAAARQDVDDLLAHIDALQAELDALKAREEVLA